MTSWVHVLMKRKHGKSYLSENLRFLRLFFPDYGRRKVDTCNLDLSPFDLSMRVPCLRETPNLSANSKSVQHLITFSTLGHGTDDDRQTDDRHHDYSVTDTHTAS